MWPYRSFSTGRSDLCYCRCIYMTEIIRGDLSTIIEWSVRRKIFTGLKSLFDIFTKCSLATKEGLLFNINVMREARERFKVSDVGFVRSENSPTSSCTNLKPNEAISKIPFTDQADFPMDQWKFQSIKEISERYGKATCTVFAQTN